MTRIREEEEECYEQYIKARLYDSILDECIAAIWQDRMQENIPK